AREEAARLWAFVRVHPALSQEGRARGELAASTLPEVAGAGTVLEEVVDGVFSRLGMG
ncbi:MAG: hypothetical protein HUU38_25990, partial [Anaerolineales bacterium]|nr:hypothetical protein [Anaerolineales bacterium]